MHEILWYFFHFAYDDLDLHEAVVLTCVVVLVEVLPEVVRGDAVVLHRLATSSVSNSSSPMLDAVLLGGDCGVLRRVGADAKRRVYPNVTPQ